MGIRRSQTILSLAVALLFVVPAFAFDEKAALELLDDKGLRRKRNMVVLPDESQIRKDIRSAPKLKQKLIRAFKQQQALERYSEANKQLMLNYVQQRRQLNQRLSNTATVFEYNQVITAINELSDRILLLYEGGSKAKELKAARKQVADIRQEYLQLLLDLRNRVNTAEKTYKEHATDSDVAAALTELKAKLGPSSSLKRDIGTLARLELTIQSESIELRRAGQVFRVDTVLNGKVSKSMIFDTGASLVTLPADLATEAGLTPGENDPTIDLQLADGSIVQGRLVVMDSLQVGKFTAHKVTCAVLPAGFRNAEPLLGGSFLRNFTYTIDPDAGKLTLTQVKAPTSKRGATRRNRK